jgi:hypothetical protein
VISYNRECSVPSLRSHFHRTEIRVAIECNRPFIPGSAAREPRRVNPVGRWHSRRPAVAVVEPVRQHQRRRLPGPALPGTCEQAATALQRPLAHGVDREVCQVGQHA